MSKDLIAAQDAKSAMIAGSAVRGIIPTDFDQAVRFAKMAVHAGMFKSKDGDAEQALAQATMAVLQGLELGIPPMQAVQQIAVINGRCCVWGDLIPALIWKHGHKIKEWIEGEGDARVAWCEIKRNDNDEAVKRKFSVDDAKQAGLWTTESVVKKWNKWKKNGPGQKDGGYEDRPNDSPWFKYSERMLQMRARGFCARDAVPDVLRGLYVREELEDVNRFREARDITPANDEIIPSSMPPMKSAPQLSVPSELEIEDQTMINGEDRAQEPSRMPQEPRKAPPAPKTAPNTKQAPAPAPAGDKKAAKKSSRDVLARAKRAMDAAKNGDELEAEWGKIEPYLKESYLEDDILRQSAKKAYEDAKAKLDKAEAA